MVLNDVKIGDNCLIGSNALIAEGKEIPDRSLVLGSPGRIVREVTDAEIAEIKGFSDLYVNNFKRLQKELALQGRGGPAMTTIGTPLSASATRVLLLGSGELGKEVAIELQRFGVEVIAADRYPNAPAMQVAHRAHAIDMLDGAALRTLIETERPDLVVPEIEAIATPTLVELERRACMSSRPRARRCSR